MSTWACYVTNYVDHKDIPWFSVGGLPERITHVPSFQWPEEIRQTRTQTPSVKMCPGVRQNVLFLYVSIRARMGEVSILKNFEVIVPLSVDWLIFIFNSFLWVHSGSAKTVWNTRFLRNYIDYPSTSLLYSQIFNNNFFFMYHVLHN